MNKQITITSKLFSADLHPLFFPFQEVTVRTGTVLTSGAGPQTQSVYPFLVNALTHLSFAMLAAEDPKRSFYVPNTTHLAIGRNSSSGGGEETFVEFRKAGCHAVLVHYNPQSGTVKAVLHKGEEKLDTDTYYLEAPKPENSDNGEAIWLAVLPSLLADAEFSDAFSKFKQLVSDADKNYIAQMNEPVSASEFSEIVLPLLNCVKRKLVQEESVKLLIPPKDTQGFLGLRPGDIRDGKCGPSMSKIMVGSFRWFSCAGSSAKGAQNLSYTKKGIKESLCKKMKWVNPCKTLQERALIPESDGMITPQIVDMITELVETQENPLATRKRFFLIEGPAGVGKSFNARMFAELNERPFVVQTLSPTDQKEDLIGGIVPITKGTDELAEVISLSEEEKKVLKAVNEASEETVYEKVAEALGYPSFALLRLDPEGCWEAVTGQKLSEGETVSIPQVMAEINHKVLSAVLAIQKKGKECEARLKEAKEEKVLKMLKEIRTKALALLARASGLTPESADYRACEKEYKALISDEKVCSFPPLDFSVLLSLFSKAPQAAMPYVPGYNGNREDFLPRYEKETEVEYKFVPSPFVRAFQNGWVCELQEATCLLNPSALSGLHDALEPESMGVIVTPYGEIRRHPDFVCIATQNRKYPGTKPLNPATRSRFQYFDCPQELTVATVMNRIGQKCAIKDRKLLKDIADVFQNLQNCARSEHLSGEMTMRAAFNFADALARGKDIEFARDHYALWSVSTDEDDLILLKNSISDCQGNA